MPTPTSATGTSANNRRRVGRSRGFTLIEILVVVLIIGIASAGVMLSLGTSGADRGLDNENERLLALMTYAREQAELQTREYGVRWHDKGYEFLVYDSLAGKWSRPNDDALRNRHLPPGLLASLRIEGREVVVPKEDAKEPVPQIMLASSGDVNSFQITILREGSTRGFRIELAENEDEIVSKDAQERATR